MATEFNKNANNMLNSPAGAKLAEKKDELYRLVNSPAGQNVKNLLQKDEASIMAAVQNGDLNVLKKTLSKILSTEDGFKIAEQIRNMMK